MRRRVLVLLVALMTVGIISGCSTTGTKRSAKSASSMQSTRVNIEKAYIQVDQTVAALNGLLDKNQDLKKQYSVFVKETDKIAAGLKKAEGRTKSMKAQGEAQFKAWQKELEGFESEEMRQRSEQRLQDALKEREDLINLAQTANENIAPFLTDLRDIRKYLDVDLSRSSVDSISDLIGKTEKDSLKVKEWLEELVLELTKIEAKLTP